MLTCKDASHLISEGQERQLSLRERLGLRFHLWICVNCRRFERQIVLLRKLLGQLPGQQEQASSAHLSPAARERIRGRLKGGD